MKKLILAASLILGAAASMNAQDISKNAIGLRLGDNDGFGGEISYQRGLSENKRLEFDLGWRNSDHHDAIKLVGLHQWVWNIEGGFNWYAGAGAGVGSWSWDHPGGGDSSNTYILLAGDIGIEYNFQEAPIQLSLDFRPEFYLGDSHDGFDTFGPDIALGIRYRFN